MNFFNKKGVVIFSDFAELHQKFALTLAYTVSDQTCELAESYAHARLLNAEPCVKMATHADFCCTYY